MSQPTREQRDVVEAPGNIFVRACPGSGKTRVIVDRYMRRVAQLAPNQGIAVLSFTNKAVDEIRERCRRGGRPELADHPHFLGTFDSFLARFLVVPFGVRGCGMAPKITDSWDWVPNLQLRGGSGPGLPLTVLSVGINGECRLDIDRVPSPQRKDVQANFRRWETALTATLAGLHRRGLFSCDDVRAIAYARVRSAAAADIGRALSARFAEVIVDEAQDCGPAEIELLRWLRRAGSKLCVVADPEQSIFEFRRADPSGVKALADELRSLPLTGNWRCSQTICNFAATLRSDAAPDRALGRHAADSEPVHVLGYEAGDSRAAGRAFAARAESLGIRPDQRVVLAYMASHAAQAAEMPHLVESAGGLAARLAIATATLHTAGADPTVRRRSLRCVQGVLLRLAGLDPTAGTPEELLERHDLDRSWLVNASWEAVAQIGPPSVGGIDAWLERARDILAAFPIPRLAANAVPVRSLLKKPTATARAALEQSTRQPAGRLRYLTVHASKGSELEAVLLVIPPHRDRHPTTDLLDAWDDRTPHDLKRVVYVGATRAKRLLALAVPQALLVRVVRILHAEKVPYRHETLADVPEAPDAPESSQLGLRLS